jgi:site-specific recombinase XerD
MTPVLGYLRSVGVFPGETAVLVTGCDALVAEFREWLARDRGLTPDAVRASVSWVSRFVAQRLCGEDGQVVSGGLTAVGLEEFIVGLSTKYEASSMGGPVAALRHFVRFASLTGLCDQSLVAAVPKVKRLRQLGLPVPVGVDVVERVRIGPRVGTLVGLRDTAIVALVADLGLRAAEITRLSLDDFDWAHALVTVIGKNGLREQMPLTQRAGQAVAEWLRSGRQVIATRHVFHTVRAPHRPLGALSVAATIRRTAEQAGVPGFSARSARHALGCAVVAGQGTLEDAGQLLRHLSMSATAIYARVDTTAMAVLAVEWPGARP